MRGRAGTCCAEKVIDLRSDLHALPTEEMWEAMRSAKLGWATYGEDPSVNELQERVGALLGQGGGALGAHLRDGEPRRAR